MFTINIVAQSGHAWTEEYETMERIQERIEFIVEEHGDIERIELLDEDGYNPENLWVCKWER
jgi:hypothetical protein